MTGWSGDGAPGTGSLREFAIGAVTQHFTKSLERVEGPDFKLPKEHQLDAMEAFQLSLGRSADFDLSEDHVHTTRTSTPARSLFINGSGDPDVSGTCDFCHTNAGALAATLAEPEPQLQHQCRRRDASRARTSRTFRLTAVSGRTANPSDGTFGNRTFNTASVVEAADTAPFFHNNVVSTLEDVVAFYSGPEFNNPRATAGRLQLQSDADRPDRRLHARREHAPEHRRGPARARRNPREQRQPAEGDSDTRLQTAFDETQDAIDVLTEGGIFPSAVTHAHHGANSGSRRRNRAVTE